MLTLSSLTVSRVDSRKDVHGRWAYFKTLIVRVCKSGYPLSGYPDLSVNFMASKNPDILVANPDIRYPKIRIS